MQFTKFTRFSAMAKTEIKRTRLKHVRERVQAGQCLNEDCTRSALSKDNGKCGLCSLHYRLANDAIDAADDPMAEAARLMYEGEYLLPHTIWKYRNPNPYVQETA